MTTLKMFYYFDPTQWSRLCLCGFLCGNRERLLNTLDMIYVIKSATITKIMKKEQNI